MGATNVHAEGQLRRPDDAGRGATSDEGTWCVDLGHAIVCTTSTELTALVTAGTLRPETRVWRDGMGYWTELAALEPEDLAPLGLPSGWLTRAPGLGPSAPPAREPRPGRTPSGGARSRPPGPTWPWVTALLALLVAGAV
ncbi:MAG: DUF4339 domain-containing protein, partial [Myxococcales bacterium]|nr:DUF4339 domain-containing protein [Myxococcales bacterium]